MKRKNFDIRLNALKAKLVLIWMLLTITNFFTILFFQRESQNLMAEPYVAFVRRNVLVNDVSSISETLRQAQFIFPKISVKVFPSGQELIFGENGKWDLSIEKKIFSGPSAVNFSTVKFWYSPQQLITIFISLFAISIVAFYWIFVFLKRKIQFELERVALKAKMELYNEVSSKLAHDIRSPVTALLVASKRIRSLYDEESSVIDSAANRILDISKDVLASSRESTEFFSANEKIEVNDLGWPEKLKNEKQTELGELLNISVIGSPKKMNRHAELQLSRILSNLINNSFEANATEVSIEFYEVPNDDKKRRINVIDNGNGIEKHILSKIGNEILSSKIDGNGIAIINAKKWLALNGGGLTVYSKPGLGTQISLEFETK